MVITQNSSHWAPQINSGSSIDAQSLIFLCRVCDNPGKHWGMDLNVNLCITEVQTLWSNLKLRSSSAMQHSIPSNTQAPHSFSWWGTALRNKNLAYAVCTVPQLTPRGTDPHNASPSAALRNYVKHLPAPNSLFRGEFYLGQIQLRILVCT